MSHVVEAAVDGDPVRDQRMLTDPLDVGDDAVLLVGDGQPVDVRRLARAWAGAHVVEAVLAQRGGLQAGQPPRAPALRMTWAYASLAAKTSDRPT